MLISTKGRYAIRLLIDLAEHNEEGKYRRLDAVAEAQDISEKYLESIVNMMVKADLIEGVRGRGGGYRLKRAPKDYTMEEILRVTEKSLSPVACLECGSNACERKDICKTLPMWEKLDDLINGYLSSVTLQDLL